MMLTRRGLAAASAAMVAAWMLPHRADAAPGLSPRLAEDLAAIDRASGGRLGVAVFDPASGQGVMHRADERFPLCSTFKLLASGAILAKVDAGKERLDRRIRFAASDLVEYSPITEHHVGGEGMTVAEICEAALTQSDNTAGNLLLALLGGPAGLTAFVRQLGDLVTRLDRTEPTLNEALPSDPRDTTTPRAMLDTMHALLMRDGLSAASKDQMIRWLVANKTGDARLRAGLPSGWRVGDKTGSGERGTANDVAIVWPPGRSPIIITAYLTGTSADADARNATLAAVGRAVAAPA